MKAAREATIAPPNPAIKVQADFRSSSRPHLRRGRVFHANSFLTHNAKAIHDHCHQDSSNNQRKDESRCVVHTHISVRARNAEKASSPRLAYCQR